jgi:hypothetical protein
VERRDGQFCAELIGPENPLRTEDKPMRLSFRIAPDKDKCGGLLTINGSTYHLTAGQYSEWVELSFKAGPMVNIRGRAKFLLFNEDDHFDLYVTALQIDAAKPIMPISHPRVYSTYLAMNQGPFATMGLAECTGALNAGILSESAFLDQCREMEVEREKMFFDMLSKVKNGLCTCVFDGTDRIQHMFFRYLDENHPACHGRDTENSVYHNAIAALYERMDTLVGKTMAACSDDGTLLMVISDHGFKAFRYGVDLNCWLKQNGYLYLKETADSPTGNIDWSRTRAYGLGLTGIYLNIRNREAQGIVEPGSEAAALREELRERLTGLNDPQTGQTAVNRVFIAGETYQGPYKDNSPDLIVGYNEGYRVSWESAIGQVTDQVFHPNTKAWSGDHCMDPQVVPGILFCNHDIQTDRPRLIDIGPTVIDLFGITPPKSMDGRPLKIA